MERRGRNISLSAWLRLSVLCLAAALLLYFVPYATLYRWLTVEHMVEWVKYAQGNPYSPIVFYIVFILAILVVPITIFPIIGGVLFGFSIALPLNLAAAMLGASMAFYIARFIGRSAVEHWLKGRLRSFDEMASHKGLTTVLFLRWTGIPPFLFANYAFGLSGIRFRDFLLGTLVGILPWMALITYASDSLWQAVLVGGQKGLAAALTQTMLPMMVLSVGILTIAAFLYWRKKKREEATVAV